MSSESYRQILRQITTFNLSHPNRSLLEKYGLNLSSSWLSSPNSATQQNPQDLSASAGNTPPVPPAVPGASGQGGAAPVQNRSQQAAPTGAQPPQGTGAVQPPQQSAGANQAQSSSNKEQLQRALSVWNSPIS